MHADIGFLLAQAHLHFRQRPQPIQWVSCVHLQPCQRFQQLTRLVRFCPAHPAQHRLPQAALLEAPAIC